MSGPGDWLVLGLVVILATVGVFVSFGSNPLAEEDDGVRKLAIGASLDPDQKVTLIGTPPFTDFLRAYMGERATVFYSWSIPCPCPAVIDPRLLDIYTEYGPEQGVSWVAIDGEPADKPEAIIEKMVGLRAFYKMVLDPQQVLVRQLGLPQAVCVAVVDGEGRLRFRGTPDNNYDEGDGGWLREALTAVLEGREVSKTERDMAYGCLFGDPESCEEYELTPEEEAAQAKREAKRKARAERRRRAAEAREGADGAAPADAAPQEDVEAGAAATGAGE